MNGSSLGRAFQRLGRSPGSVDVILERNTFAPGDLVSGVVLLHITHAVQGAELLVRLLGMEHIHSVYKDEGSTTTNDALHEFVNASSPLLDRTPLAPGDLQIPFAFQLPLNTPATSTTPYAIEAWEGRAQLHIKYGVECKLKIHDIAFGDQYQQTAFKVSPGHGPIARFVGQPVECSATRTFKYGFFKDGSCAMTVRLDTNVGWIGSVFAAAVKLQLVPEDRLETVKVSLFRRIKPNWPTPQWQNESRAMKSDTWTRSMLGDGKDFVLKLGVPISRLTLDPLTPTGTFHLVSISYEIVVECHLKRCGKVSVAFPVAVVESEQVALGVLNAF